MPWYYLFTSAVSSKNRLSSYMLKLSVILCLDFSLKKFKKYIFIFYAGLEFLDANSSDNQKLLFNYYVEFCLKCLEFFWRITNFIFLISCKISEDCNMFYAQSSKKYLINRRWIVLISFNQKFYRLWIIKSISSMTFPSRKLLVRRYQERYFKYWRRIQGICCSFFA